jgi:hypothetical protein
MVFLGLILGFIVFGRKNTTPKKVQALLNMPIPTNP